MKIGLTLKLVVTFFIIPICANTQQTLLNNTDSVLRYNDSIANALIRSPYSDSLLNNTTSYDALKKDTVYLMYQQAQMAYYMFKKNEFVQANRVFNWQLITSKIIFIIVNLIVLSGIWFSGVQFYSSLRKGEKAEESKFVISGKGVSISSSVLGLLILILSIVFFYLYLVHVYPIKPI
jgi:hypothetical protein